ncbi:MAG: hypothetical protein AAF648_07455 [Pseudomonadota bacterium]
MQRRLFLWVAAGLLSVFAGLTPSTARAFKIGTHVWIADRLIEEIGSGRELSFVDINELPFATAPVNAQLAASIRQFPEAFRFGSLGADIYPDLVAGQMTTHPGLPFEHRANEYPADVLNLRRTLGLTRCTADGGGRRVPCHAKAGWQTDDWLFHVRRVALDTSPGTQPTPQLAFAYGYLLHAAMDTWAHSYVNIMTGDLFSLQENPHIAARHTALETFINAAHKQPVIDRSGRAAPAWFVRQALILNDEAAEQYARSEAAQHLYAMWAWWRASQRIRGQLVPVREAIDARLGPAQAAVENADALWRAADRVKNDLVRAANEAAAALSRAETRLLAAEEVLNAEAQRILDEAGSLLEPVLSAFPALQAAYNSAKQAEAMARAARSQARAALDRALRDRDAQIQEVARLADDLDLKRATFDTLDAARNQFWASADATASAWTANVEAAVDAYVVAFETTARRIMRPKGGRFTAQQSSLEPIKTWATCYGPAFGMPQVPGLHQTCSNVLTDYNALRAEFTALKNNLTTLPFLRDRVRALDDTVHEMTADGLTGVSAMIGKAVPNRHGASASGFIAFAGALWDKHVQAADLSELYSTDKSGKALPIYNKHTSELVQILEDDGLPIRWVNTQSGRGIREYYAEFEAMLEFKPFHNAYMLSKLTLLEGGALDQLGAQKVRNHPQFSRVLNPGSFPRYGNDAPAGAILMGAIRSIDGNHQWQPVAPRLPFGLHPGVHIRGTSATCRRFGYPASGSGYALPPDLADKEQDCGSDDRGFQRARNGLTTDPKRGFLFWRHPMLRSTVFNCIFDGPVSVGVCDRLRGDAAVQHGCSAEPFPDSSVTVAQQEAQLGRQAQQARAAAAGRGNPWVKTVPDEGGCFSAPLTGVQRAGTPGIKVRRAPNLGVVLKGANPGGARQPGVTLSGPRVSGSDTVRKATPTAGQQRPAQQQSARQKSARQKSAPTQVPTEQLSTPRLVRKPPSD